MQTFTPAKLSSNRVKTPEGFLLCKDVAFARVGELLYAPGELPIAPGPDGVVRITRDADVLFAQETLDSFLGKSVTYRHPPAKADASNWRTVEAGTILSARRGAGAKSDFMVGDIIVKDQETIDVLDSGAQVEVSNGYDATYQDQGNGRGRQIKIRGNHLALLPPGTRGRCGSECFVGDEGTCFVADQAMDIEEPPMTTKPTGILAAIRRIAGVKDEAELQGLVEQMTADEQAAIVADKDAQIATLTADIARLTGELADAKKAPVVTHDAAKITAFRARIASAAEILSPGYTIPTFDAAADMTATYDGLVNVQRETLAKAVASDDKGAIVSSILDGADVSKMTTDELDTAFMASATALGAINNATLADLTRAGLSANPMTDQYALIRKADEASKKRWAKPAAVN